MEGWQSMPRAQIGILATLCVAGLLGCDLGTKELARTQLRAEATAHCTL